MPNGYVLGIDARQSTKPMAGLHRTKREVKCGWQHSTAETVVLIEKKPVEINKLLIGSWNEEFRITNKNTKKLRRYLYENPL